MALNNHEVQELVRCALITWQFVCVSDGLYQPATLDMRITKKTHE